MAPIKYSDLTIFRRIFLQSRPYWVHLVGIFLLSLLAAPLYYTWSPPDFFFWVADTLPEALLCSLFGAVVLLISLHLANGLGWIWRQLAEFLLGSRTSTPTVEEGASAT